MKGKASKQHSFQLSSVRALTLVILRTGVEGASMGYEHSLGKNLGLIVKIIITLAVSILITTWKCMMVEKKIACKLQRLCILAFEAFSRFFVGVSLRISMKTLMRWDSFKRSTTTPSTLFLVITTVNPRI